jgi:hypothetical protein
MNEKTNQAGLLTDDANGYERDRLALHVATLKVGNALLEMENENLRREVALQGSSLEAAADQSAK